MEASGHKTQSIFRRYDTVTIDELKVLVGEKIRLKIHLDSHHSKSNPANPERL
jgi:hypothetical protein